MCDVRHPILSKTFTPLEKDNTITNSFLTGFTLIELILVVAIVAVLAAVMIPMVTSARQEARVAKILETWQTLTDAARLYYADTGVLPIENPNSPIPWDNLSQNSGLPGWDGPYIDKPLTNGDNPYGGIASLIASAPLLPSGKTQQGSVLILTNIPESAARKINDALDNNEPGLWDSTGRVLYGGGVLSMDRVLDVN